MTVYACSVRFANGSSAVDRKISKINSINIDDSIELKFHNSDNSQLILNGLDTIPSIIYQRKSDNPAIKYVFIRLAPDNTTNFIERYVIFND